MKIYLGGSLQNEKIKFYANELRSRINNVVVFDDWMGAHPEADEKWREYSNQRCMSYEEAIRSNAGQNVFTMDLLNLISSDVFILVLPAGKSAHLEAGFMAGLRYAGFGKRMYILLDAGSSERYDVMYAFADKVFTSFEDLLIDVGYDKAKYFQDGRL